MEIAVLYAEARAELDKCVDAAAKSVEVETQKAVDALEAELRKSVDQLDKERETIKAGKQDKSKQIQRLNKLDSKKRGIEMQYKAKIKKVRDEGARLGNDRALAILANYPDITPEEQLAWEKERGLRKLMVAVCKDTSYLGKIIPELKDACAALDKAAKKKGGK